MFSIRRKTNSKSAATRTDPANFPMDAWQHITLEAPETLELYGKQNRGHLQVTLTNNSGQLLDPGTDGDLAFSFRLIDHKGKPCPLNTVRTPLTQPVAPGATHRQPVKVLIPRADLEQAATIRVSLLREGHYWVENLNPRHPCTVQICCTENLDTHDALIAAGRQIWEQGKGNGMRWPYGSMMVSQRHKLFYIPVAKCACTSLKSMMVKLAGIQSPELAIELGIHLIADRFNTGVQLKDQPIDLAREILASDQYFKFSVIRDPFERLVSAYLEKFVYQRNAQNNLMHTTTVIRDVQGTDDIDVNRGICFDDFMGYILRQDPYDLDPHWRPQYLYFRGVPHISRIFRLDNIAELEAHLLHNHGVEIKLGHANATGKSDRLLPEASELTASELDSRGALDPESFLASKHVQAIRRYYREDFEFYKRAGT